MKEIVAMCYKAGAKKVSVASAAAEVRFPNVYGIDMAAKKDLIASSRSNDEIRDFLGCDNLVYQSLKDLEESVLELNPDLEKLEKSIFNGEYPTDISSDYLEKLEVKRGWISFWFLLYLSDLYPYLLPFLDILQFHWNSYI